MFEKHCSTPHWDSHQAQRCYLRNPDMTKQKVMCVCAQVLHFIFFGCLTVSFFGNNPVQLLPKEINWLMQGGILCAEGAPLFFHHPAMMRTKLLHFNHAEEEMSVKATFLTPDWTATSANTPYTQLLTCPTCINHPKLSYAHLTGWCLVVVLFFYPQAESKNSRRSKTNYITNTL